MKKLTVSSNLPTPFEARPGSKFRIHIVSHWKMESRGQLRFWQPENQFRNREISNRRQVLNITNRSEGTSIHINGRGAASSSSKSIQRVTWAVLSTNWSLPLPWLNPSRHTHWPPHHFLTSSLTPCLLNICAEPIWQKHWRVWGSHTWVDCLTPRPFSTSWPELLWTQENTRNFLQASSIDT